MGGVRGVRGVSGEVEIWREIWSEIWSECVSYHLIPFSAVWLAMLRVESQ